MSGKGSRRRPGDIPSGAWESIFKPKMTNPDPEPYDPEPLADAEQDLKGTESPMRPSYERRKYER